MAALDASYISIVFPILTVICILAFFWHYRKSARPLSGTTEWITDIVNRPRFSFRLTRCPMEREDALPLIIILAVFTFLAFFGLGDTKAPQSFFEFTQYQKQIVIELEDETDISEIMFYTGLYTGGYELEFSQQGTNWTKQEPHELLKPKDEQKKELAYAMAQPHSNLFKWRTADLNEDREPVRLIRISAQRTPIELGELAIYSGDKLIPANDIICYDAPELFDEQAIIPESATYMNSMYFDEIYHGRTALEHLRNIYPYETTHPPLGKLFISAGISMFQMTPFGWRFIGALFGVIMLAVLYIFLKNMFGRTVIATCGTLLFAFDFMRFTQTRIATIDTYAVLFILLSYFFMYRYISTGPRRPFMEGMRPLALSGLFFGIGCASKWVVVYAGFGLLALFVIHLVMIREHYTKNVLEGYGALIVKTLLGAALFFVVAPVIIYCLSYIPYGTAKGMSIGDGMLWNKDFYKIIWDNQVSMYNYHSGLTEGHPYASPWWQWVLDLRPILYYANYQDSTRAAFGAFGNPVVWWGGLLAMAATCIRFIKKRDGRALFIVIGYLSQIVPWLLVSRALFIYHYFPSTLFLVLALAYVFDTIIERGLPRSHESVYAYTVSAGVLFAMFYPVLTGVRVPRVYAQYILRWFPGMWPF